MEEKIAHLGFVQGVINRMGNNSFLIKGFTITLIAAIFALSSNKTNGHLNCIALFSLIFFWYLDAFFLHQERLYRKLYEKIATGIESSSEFTMNTQKYATEVDSIYKVFRSKTLILFYLPIALITLFI